jgi:hypothetical protein
MIGMGMTGMGMIAMICPPVFFAPPVETAPLPPVFMGMIG